MREHAAMMTGLRALRRPVEVAAELVAERLRDGGAVYWFGNGGSTTQAMHLATELVGRFERERRGLRSLALGIDASLVTSIGNDYSFDDVFARQLDALARRGDVAIGLSTSGNSPNVLQAIDAARSIGVVSIGLTGGDGGELARRVDLPIVVPHVRTCRIQEAHLFLGHLLCELVDDAVASAVHVRSA